MFDPMSSGIRGEGKAIYGASVDVTIEAEEDAEASMCKKRMCRFGKKVIA
jgi:hypothetical protein